MTKKLALFIIFIKIMVASSETVTLEQLLKSGLENNNLIILKEKSLNSQIKDIEILKSTVKPKISLDLSYDIYKNENVIGNPWIKNYVLSEDKVGIYLILKQNIYDGGIYNSKNKMSIIDKNTEFYNLENEKQEFYSKVYILYYDILKEEELLKLKKEMLKKLELDKFNAELYLKNEKIIYTDLLKIGVEILNIEQEILSINNNIAILKNEMKKNTGFSIDDRELIIPKELDEKKLEDIKSLIEKAYKNEIELKKLENNLEKIKYENEILRSTKKPNISLQGLYGIDIGQGEEFDNWTLSINISQNIYEGGKSKKTEEKLQIEKEKINISKLEIKENIKNNLEKSLKKLSSLSLIKEKNIKNLRFNEEILKVEELKYNNETIDINDLISARLNLMTANQNYIRSNYEYEQEKVRIYRLIGEIYNSGGKNEKQ